MASFRADYSTLCSVVEVNFIKKRTSGKNRAFFVIHLLYITMYNNSK